MICLGYMLIEIRGMQQDTTSMIAVAVTVLIVNITGGQIIEGLTDYQKSILRSKYVRWFAILAVVYAALNNIWMALIVGGFAIVSLDYLLNENSRYYLFRRYEQGKLKTIGTDAVKSWNVS